MDWSCSSEWTEAGILNEIIKRFEVLILRIWLAHCLVYCRSFEVYTEGVGGGGDS